VTSLPSSAPKLLLPTIASTLATRITLRNIYFAGIEAKSFPSSEAGGQLAFEMGKVAAGWLLDGRNIRAIFPYLIHIRRAETEGGGAPVAELGLQIRVDYQISEDAPEPSLDDLDHYVGVSGFLHTWPYLRSEVQALTSKLGLPTLVLPLVVSGNAVALVSVRHDIGDQVRPSSANARVEEV
jgi:hypothetical protein